MKIKNLLNKRILGTIPLFALILVVAGGGIASAALLNYYGTITGAATVSQSVLVDNGDYEATNEYDASGVAGSTVTSVHALTNNADESAKVKLVTDQEEGTSINTPNSNGGIVGITTKYYELAGFSGTIKESETDIDLSTDPYQDTYGDVDYSVSYEGKKVVFTVDTPSEMIDTEGYDNIAFEFDNDADGTPDWQVKYQPNAGKFGDYDWGYKEYDGSSWTAFQDASSVVTVERTDGTFTVTVDPSKLGGFGSDYKYGFQIGI